MAADANKKTLLIESQYFPNISFYRTLINHDNLLLERHEHYQKLSFRNRCYIAGPNGRILLSVPLARGKNQRTVMKDVRISNDERWQALHWKTLVSAYRRSPWFEYYEDEMGLLYKKPVLFLLDWNMLCFELANKITGVSMPFAFTDEYHKTYEAPGINDMRDIIRPEEKEVEEDTVRYTQVFQDRVGFLPDLSILDLIFCEGKRSLELIK
ncbi:WbqC-like protein family protein [Chitinophaga sp. YR627]|uniref:WbqC family protein n=1 Tax=Chitinophaga sp. YR627 TaxID=1881041 RepID=UPI0008DFE65B|nr:WbqC family protein [Chitinophaga sp. YR627]SFO56530.1 WbqC-like protein family protein [Chitinophaga sp. YR627]